MKLKQILLITTILFSSVPITAQDLIYRKNGEVVKAKILNTTDKSLSYKLYERADSFTYFINVSIIDSIVYKDGKKETYLKKIEPVAQQPKELITNYYHHLIGADLTGLLFYRNLIVSYEYLPGKAKLGYKAAFAVNLDPIPYYDYGINSYPGNSYRYGKTTKWSARIGMNYYIFPPRTFRFGTGLYYLFGSYSSEKTIYNSDHSSSTIVTDNKNIQGIILSLFAFYNINKDLAINLGMDALLYFNPSSANYVIRCEILYNF